MLPKKQRANKKLIDEIFSKGRFINSTYLSLKYLINKGSNDKIISFVVPKTVAKRAVDRNLLKRRGYYLIQKILYSESKKENPSLNQSKNGLFIPKGFMGVFMFKKNSLSIFGGKKGKNRNPINDLELEISLIISKISTF